MAEDDATEENTAEEKVEETPKKKKVIRRRKTKKERENPVTVAIRLAVESGKVGFGARTGLTASILGKAKVFVLPNNTPKETKERVEKYAEASKIPTVHFDGTSVGLGSVCGKPFPVSVLSIYDVGSSSIMKLTKK